LPSQLKVKIFLSFANLWAAYQYILLWKRGVPLCYDTYVCIIFSIGLQQATTHNFHAFFIEFIIYPTVHFRLYPSICSSCGTSLKQFRALFVIYPYTYTQYLPKAISCTFVTRNLCPLYTSSSY
jgi:hypothetical protein